MGGKKGLRLLQHAKNSPYGWRREELDKLYKQYGFIIENGKKHDIVRYPGIPDLITTLTRSSSELHPDYVRYAVTMIETLLELKKG
jgi:hypothetical protein